MSVLRCTHCGGSVLAHVCLLCARTFTVEADGSLVEVATRAAEPVRRVWVGPINEMMTQAAKSGRWL